MSAAEVIAMIEQLPPTEKAVVIAYAKEAAAGGLETRTIRYLSDEKVAEVSAKVFEKHHELFRRLAQ